MAQFTVPQFIESEPKIVGPFTFKQAIYIGIAGTILFILYFSVPLGIFVLAALVLLPLSLACALVKINGVPLPTIIKNFLLLSFSPKIYVWRKASIPIIKTVKKEKKKEKEETQKTKEEPKTKTPPLKVAEESKLKKLLTELEMKKF